LVNRAGSFVGPFLALYLGGERGMTLDDVGLVLAALGVGSTAAGPLGGALADSLGRRPTMALATSLGAAAMLGLGWASAKGAILGAAFALGLFGEMYRPTVAAIVADIVPVDDRPRAYGLLHWAVNIGVSVSPVLAGFLAATHFRLLFVLDAWTTFVFGLVVVAALRREDSQPKRPASEPRPSLLTPYADPTFLLLLASATLLAVVFLQGQVALPLDLRAHGVSPRTYGLLIALNGALVVAFQPFASSRARRMRRSRALVAGALLTGLGWGINGVAHGTIGMYAAAIVVWTVGEIVLVPILPALVADLAPATLRGSYQGAYQVTFGVASVAGPLGGSAVLMHLGSSTLWGGCVAAGVIAAAGYAGVASRLERRPRPPLS
jgi:MFS family permease